MAEREILTEMLARVEGEGAMEVRVRDGRVEDVKLRIYEPPRFFEAFLRGRRFTEPPDITARICGICPVAYQLSACAAIEDACGVEVDEPIRRLRRLLYCGEWLQSHALHVFMLPAPDFLASTGRWRWRTTGIARSCSGRSPSRRPATRSSRRSAGAPCIRSTCASAGSTAPRPPRSCVRSPSSSRPRERSP